MEDLQDKKIVRRRLRRFAARSRTQCQRFLAYQVPRKRMLQSLAEINCSVASDSSSSSEFTCDIRRHHSADEVIAAVQSQSSPYAMGDSGSGPSIPRFEVGSRCACRSRCGSRVNVFCAATNGSPLRGIGLPTLDPVCFCLRDRFGRRCAFLLPQFETLCSGFPDTALWRKLSP